MKNRFIFLRCQPVCVQPRSPLIAQGGRVLVQVPPQSDLGRGEACVIGQHAGGVLLPLPGVRGAGCVLVVRRDGQVAGDELPLGTGSVVTRRAGAVHGELRADAVDRRRGGQTQFGVHLRRRAGLVILSVGGAVARAVRFELQQLLLPLTFLQLHDADLETDTRGSHYTGKIIELEQEKSNKLALKITQSISYLQLQAVSLFFRDLPAQCLFLFQQTLQTQSAPVELQLLTPRLQLQNKHLM